MRKFERISIIVPAYNEERNIRTCIESLLLIEAEGIGKEIIVVDNGSSDRTVEIGREMGATVLSLPGKPISAVRNFGVRHSTGELLGFVDADCVVSKGWLTKGIECMNYNSADAVGSFHIIPDESGWLAKTGELIQRQKKGAEPSYIPSGNMIVKRAAFEAVGGFDESLETDEDVDICNRLKKNGYKLFLSPGIKCTHLGIPRNVKEMILREIWHGKGTWIVFYRDLRRIRNLRIFLYSALNLIFIVMVIFGLYLFIFGNIDFVLFLGLITYSLLNLIVAVRDWLKIKGNILYILLYVMIYGIGKSISLLRWFTIINISK